MFLWLPLKDFFLKKEVPSELSQSLGMLSISFYVLTRLDFIALGIVADTKTL